MKKEKINILYVDPNSEDEHINFNNIYIHHLLKEDINVSFSFKEGYHEKINLPEKSEIFQIPQKLFESDNKSPIHYRLNFIKKIRYLKKNVDLDKYQAVFFSSYDELSLYFCFLKKRLILVNHNNLQRLNSVKKFFYKRNSKNNIQIVFDEESKKFLSQNNLSEKVFVIRHGIPPKIEYNEEKLEKVFFDILSENGNKMEEKKYILFPSKSSTDLTFLEELNSSEKFISFIEKEKIVVILRNKISGEQGSKNIVVLDGFIDNEKYNALFLKSHLICLKYNQEFKYRSSGVFFESISNDKRVMMNNIPAFLSYKSFFQYDPYFSDISTLIDKIKELIDKKGTDLFNDKSLLNPNFKNLFDYLRQS